MKRTRLTPHSTLLWVQPVYLPVSKLFVIRTNIENTDAHKYRVKLHFNLKPTDDELGIIAPKTMAFCQHDQVDRLLMKLLVPVGGHLFVHEDAWDEQHCEDEV